MKVYKLKIKGDQKVYWLTEKSAFPIMKKWQSGEMGVFTLPTYGIMCHLNKIRDIRAVEEQEPYPNEFKEQLRREGSMNLPDPNDRISQIKKLPYKRVILDKNWQPTALKERDMDKAFLANPANNTYILADCYYTGDEENPLFYTKREMVKEALFIRLINENGIPIQTIYRIERFGELCPPFNED